MKVTRAMVAKHAGVSNETVSYVLNRSRPVSDKIIEKVMNSVKELNYTPDLIARSMVKNKTQSIGIVCDDLSNPYYSDILYGIECIATKSDQTILICDAKPNFKQNIETFIARRVDGIILLVSAKSYESGLLDRLLQLDIPVVLTHSGGDIDSRFMQLEPDFKKGITDALNFLKERGHENIAFLSAYGEDYKYDNRRESFKDCYEQLFGKKAIIYDGEKPYMTKIYVGRALIEKLLKDRQDVSAVITTNDLLAIGVMDYLKEQGKEIPKDMSVIGIDDMIFSKYITPKLTTIGYDKTEYGRRIFTMLKKAMNKSEPFYETFEMSLVERESATFVDILKPIED